MNGMYSDMQVALRGANSDITVISFSPKGISWSSYLSLVDQIKETIDIEGYAPFTQHQAFIIGKKKPMVTLIKGIDLSLEPTVTPLYFLVRKELFEIKRDNTISNQALGESALKDAKATLQQLAEHTESYIDNNGNQGQKTVSGILVGSQLARSLGVRINDQVTIMSLESESITFGNISQARRFKVVGYYETSNSLPKKRKLA